MKNTYKDLLSRFVPVMLYLVLSASTSFAVPGVINYQGRLTNTDGTPADGDKAMVFSLYTTATGGGSVWSEGLSVTVTDGSFSVELGGTSPIPDTLFDNDKVYLGVKVDTDAEMTPRQRLTSTGYTFRAESALYAGNAGNATNADTVDGMDTTELVQTADHTKAAHDAMGINADQVDGQHAADIIDAATDEVRIPISYVPFSINASGSYYFTQNLHYTSATGNAITVNVDNVTFDMMGYSLIGFGNSSGSSNGIYMNNYSNIEVRNGTVRDFGYRGIYAGTSAENIRVMNMRVIGNGYTGIQLGGKGHIVKDCNVSGNGLNGISVVYYSTVTGSTTLSNDGSGINVHSGCTVSGNTSAENLGCGIYASTGNTISNNVVHNNTKDGVYANGGGNLILDNVARANNQENGISQGGIHANSNCTIRGNSTADNLKCNIYASGCVIDGNTATGSEYGINVGGSVYANNRTRGNTTANYYNTPSATDGGGNVSF